MLSGVQRFQRLYSKDTFYSMEHGKCLENSTHWHLFSGIEEWILTASLWSERRDDYVPDMFSGCIYLDYLCAAHHLN